jgi:hypothetical protein
MYLHILKQFTKGINKDTTIVDSLTIRSISDLNWLERIGEEIEAIGGNNYIVLGVAIYDPITKRDINKKQAIYRLNNITA